jgi:hypothetical protein
VRRRQFITLLGGAAVAWPVAARAQRPFKIGLLDTGLGAAFTVPFSRKLVELGYIEGKNIVIERRAAEGNAVRLKEFAADLVGQQVDVIVTAGTPAGVAAKQATSVIPIVLGAISDPVGIGLVESLARPGGNATGNSLMAPDLSGKRLEILHTLAPGITRFAILWDSSNPGMAERVNETKRAAGQSHVLLHPVGPRNLEELDAAFAELLKEKPASRATNEVRTGDQSSNCQGARPQHSTDIDCACRSGDRMNRRAFISLLGGAAAVWPVAVRAQQATMPVIGFLHPTSFEAFAENLRGFGRASRRPGTSKGRMLRSSFAGLTVSLINCRSSQLIWFADVSPSLRPHPRPLHSPPGRRPQRSLSSSAWRKTR